MTDKYLASVATMIWSIAHGAEAFRAAVWTSATRLTITTRNRRLVQDYGDGLRQFIGHVLAAVQIAIAVVLRHCCTGRRFQPSCSSCSAPFGTTAASAMRTDTPPLVCSANGNPRELSAW